MKKRILYGLAAAVMAATFCRGQSIQFIWASPIPPTANSGIPYYVVLATQGGGETTLFKNGYFLASDYGAAEAITTDIGAQGVYYSGMSVNPNTGSTEWAPSIEVTIRFNDQAPNTPTGLGASNIRPTSLTLSWNAATGNGIGVVTGYEVRRDGTSMGFTTATSWQVSSGLDEATTHLFEVRAKDDFDLYSAWTPLTVRTQDITGPGAPAGLSASALTSSSVTLQWNAAIDNADWPDAIVAYEVRRDNDAVATVTGSPPALTTSISGLTAGRNYSMRVRAQDNSGDWGALSAPVTVEVPTPYGAAALALPSQGSSLYQGTNPNNPEGWIVVAASGSITTSPSVTIASAAKVKFVAGSRITLGDGFHACSGATFAARVGTDNTDSDQDGMTDLFELTSGLNPVDANDALTDKDNDGLTNIAEFNLGSDAAFADAGAASTGGSLPANWPVADPLATTAVGITAGELSVGPSGAATYSIPIWVTPGTAGMEPKLTINYSSQAGGGILGWGWSLGGLSAISRGPQTLAVDGSGYVPGINLGSTDRFYLDGQRLINVSGNYGDNATEYRTEFDSFSRVISYSGGFNGPASFKVWTKAGLIIEFGNTTSSRVMAGTAVRTWSVNRISDTFGNYIDFVYETDVDPIEQRLVRIDYTGHSANPILAPYASVRFEYESRMDTTSGYFCGHRYGSSKRLAALKVYHGETAIRTYLFAYQYRPMTYRSMLVSITETGVDNVQLKPLTFDYSQSEAGWNENAGIMFNSGIPSQYLLADNTGSSPKPTGTGFIDFDGDGRTDFVCKKGGDTGVAYRNTGSGWQSAPGYAPPWALIGGDGLDSGSRFVDFDGDGLVDFVWHEGGASQIGAVRNTGTGWATAATSWRPPARIARDNSQLYSGQFMDMNGDGRPDYVTYFTPGGNATDTPQVYLNTGSGWSTTAHSGFAAVYFNGGTPFPLAEKKTRFVDLNGDGLPDMVTYHRNGNGSSDTGASKGAWLNTGSGWSYAGQYIPLRYIACADYGTVGCEFVDANADGLVDQVWNLNYSSGAALNTGNGWVQNNTYRPNEVIARLVGSETRGTSAFVDINGDGLIDDASAYGISSGGEVRALSVGTGRGFTFGPWASRLPAVLALGTAEEKYAGLDLVDLNGDGITDAILRRRNHDGTYSLHTWINNASQTDRLVRVTNGFGVEAQINYLPATSASVYTKGTTLDPIDVAERPNVANVVGPMMVVFTVVHDDGAGGNYTLQYSYGGMRAHRIRGSLGFEWMTVTDTRTDIVNTTEFNQNFPFVGMPVETFTKTNGGSGVTLSESTTIYDKRVMTTTSASPHLANPAGHKIYFPFAKESLSKSRDLDGGLTSVSRTITQRGAMGSTNDYDSYGNSLYVAVISGDTEALVTNADETDDYRKVTTNAYTNTVAADKWHLGRLDLTTVVSAAPGVPLSLARSSGFTYDDTSGVLLTETVEPGSTDATVKLTTTYGYDTFGNRTSVSTQGISGDARTATSGYDTQGRFVTSRTNALGHSEEFETDPGLGVITWHEGPNHQVTTWELDAFGRVVRENRADGTYTTTRRLWAGAYAPANAQHYVQTQTFHTAGGGTVLSAPAVEFFDRYGRSVRKLGVNGDGRAVATDTTYDSLGRAYRSSAPFYLEDGPSIWTETTSFDVLNRPLVVRLPDEEVAAGYVTTTYQYGSRSVLAGDANTAGTVGLVTNPKGMVTMNVTNSQGWTVEIVQNATGLDFDPGSAEEATTTKTYDALGQLLSVNAEGTTIVNTYDVRGRRTQTVDPNMGTWVYAYNAFGELSSQQDQAGNVTTMEYDELGRMKKRVIYPAAGAVDYGPKETTEWAYYDTLTTGGWIGSLKSVSTFLGADVAPDYEYREVHTYGPYGRPAAVARTIHEGTTTANYVTYTTRFDYDDVGRLEQTHYPDMAEQDDHVIIENCYNAFSVLKEVRRVDHNSNRVLWMAAPAGAYNAAGALEDYYLGNGVSTTRVHSGATGRLRSIDTGRHFGTDVQALLYNYDEVGNALIRDDATIGRYETFQYDALNRLTQHYMGDDGLLATPVQIDVTYHANGNIAQKSGVGSYAYANTLSSRPHAVTSITGGVGTGDYPAAAYEYDLNGNMIRSGVSDGDDGVVPNSGREFQWTAFNQVRRIDKIGGNFSEFRFGAGHERVWQKSNHDTTVYVGSLFEKHDYQDGVPLTDVLEYWHWISTPAGRVAVHKVRPHADPQPDLQYTQYFHQDALGSVTAVTNECGVVSERYAYDAWGKRYDPVTPNFDLWCALTTTWETDAAKMPRGFTDHEMLDHLGLIHMNGRIYDPMPGRFLSADPFIDGSEDSQGYNRYSYVLNNPLNATDPTGYLSLGDLLGADLLLPGTGAVAATTYLMIRPWTLDPGYYLTPCLYKQYAPQVAGAVAGAFANYFFPGTGSAVYGFVSGFYGSLINDGSIGDAFRSGLIGAGVAAATQVASGRIHRIFGDVGTYDAWGEAGRATAHGLVGGGIEELRGGEFRHGFYSSFAGSVAGSIAPYMDLPGYDDTRPEAIAARTCFAAAVGGTASVLGGGKFANGAITAAFQHLFNAEGLGESLTTEQRKTIKISVKVKDVRYVGPDDPLYDARTGGAVVYDRHIGDVVIDCMGVETEEGKAVKLLGNIRFESDTFIVENFEVGFSAKFLIVGASIGASGEYCLTTTTTNLLHGQRITYSISKAHKISSGVGLKGATKGDQKFEIKSGTLRGSWTYREDILTWGRIDITNR